MERWLGLRGIAALGGILLAIAGGSTGASAQVSASVQASPAVVVTTAPAQTGPLTLVAAGTTALAVSPVAPAQAVPSVTTPLDPAAAWDTLLAANSIGDMDDEATCLATAVYFESRGESPNGQLAVAQVVINRARSGRYPPTLCAVVRQPAQFSFVRHGGFPQVDEASTAWSKAQAIARIALKQAVQAELPSDVLWYHADYVAPRWREALVQVQKIGAHIFYRA